MNTQTTVASSTYTNVQLYGWVAESDFQWCVRHIARFLKAIISQKQGEKQQITEYNWENKVYECGGWMR